MISVRCKGGLGNRLKALVSAVRLSDLVTEQVYIDSWPKTFRDDADYTDLFENNFAEGPVSEEARQNLVTGWRLKVQDDDPVPIGFSSIKNFSNDESDLRYIDFEYSRIPKLLQQIYSDAFRAIKPAQHILNTVDNFFENCGAHCPVIGLQVRTWNEPRSKSIMNIGGQLRIWRDARSRKSSSIWIEINTVIENILHRDNSAIIFICSDDIKLTLSNIKNKFKKNVVSFESFDYANRPKTKMEIALCEMLILSRMKELAVTRYSTFGECAWWLGDCKAAILYEFGREPATQFVNVPDQPWCVPLSTGLMEHIDNPKRLARAAIPYYQRYRELINSPLAGIPADDDIMIDVGANIGLSCIPVALEPLKRRILAFEPLEENASALRSGFLANGVSPQQFEIFETAVGCPGVGKEDSIILHVPEARSDNASVGGRLAANLNVQKSKVAERRVRYTSLDTLYEEGKLVSHDAIKSIKLLKIDVQGHEESVLRGAEKLLKACREHKRLIIEFEADPKLLEASGTSLDNLIGLLENLGMATCSWDGQIVTREKAHSLSGPTDLFARYN